MEETPRSTISAFGTPRDDRFYSPREHAWNRTSRSSSSRSASDDWITPRQDALISALNSDAEFQTPRTHYDYEQTNALSGRSPASYRNYDERAPCKEEYNDHRYLSVQDRKETSGTISAHYRYDEKGYREDIDYDASELADTVTEQDIQDIFSFARHGRCEEIEKLFNRGLPVDVRDEFGNTLLIIACQNGNKRVAKLVLRKGANINGRNYKGNTPLHYCFHYGYGDSLGQYLISKGADESARNNAGKPCWDGI